MEFPPGTILDRRFAVEAAAGRGGLGLVVKAWDMALGHTVALKLLHSDGDHAKHLFDQERSFLETLAHPNLARLLDVGQCVHDGQPLHYAVQEFIEGGSILTIADDLGQTIAPLCDALDALAWLHRAGVRHGDLTPQNILVRGDGSGVLIDLSAAMTFRKPGEPLDEFVMGTPGFIAPEMLDGRAGDARSDLYAFGQTLQALLESANPRPSAPPEAILRLIGRLVHHDPDHRPVDAMEVRTLLRAHATTPIAARPPMVVLPAEPGRLIGRDSERHQFAQFTKRLRENAPGCRALLLRGPRGIGKSRLLRDFIGEARHHLDVVPGIAIGRRSLSDLLARASEHSPDEHEIDAMLLAVQSLRAAQRPTLLCLDDVHLLSDRERQILPSLIRATGSTGNLAWLLCGGEDPLGANEDTIVVGPLTTAAVRTWTQEVAPDVSIAEVMEATHGVPAYIRDFCRRALGGKLSASPTSRRAPRSSTGRSELLVLLPEPLSDELCRWALMQALDPSCALLVAPKRAPQLVALGAVLPTSQGLRLSPGLHPQSVLGRFPASSVKAATAIAEEARAIAIDGDPERYARALAIDIACTTLRSPDDACSQLLSAKIVWAPSAFHHAARFVAEHHLRPEPALVEAEALVQLGRHSAALSALARTLTIRPRIAGELRSRLHRCAAICYEQQGHLGKAERQLQSAASSTTSSEPIAQWCIEARVLVRRGRYADALALTERALKSAPDDPEVIELAGLSMSYLGQSEPALRHLERAATLRRENDPPRESIRAQSYLALHLYRTGNIRAAAEGFCTALLLAEQAGLVDQIAIAALNLGTANHQAGDWGGALDAYDRGLRAAVAFGRHRTALTLRFNLAKLHADIGSWQRAEAEIPSIESQARELGANDVETGALALRAEIAAVQSDWGAVLTALDQALTAYRARGAKREQCESQIQISEAHLGRDNGKAALSCLRAATEIATELDAQDLLAQCQRGFVRYHLAQNDPETALTYLRRAEEGEGGDHLALRAELADLAALTFRLTGAPTTAGQRQTQANEAWERIASSLPVSLRPTFWRHPRRRNRAAEPSLARSSELPLGPTDGQATELRQRRILRLIEINRRLSSTLDLREILRFTMDAAIELTGAERGFVLLATHKNKRRTARLEVAEARNIDRERLGRSHFKFSHTIAERVVREGVPVLTMDAQQDQRFSEHVSVHQMQLRSIICVPIRAAENNLGALYLDNRFSAGRFSPDDMQMLSAFSDQVAIALSNSRLLSELRERTRELEAKEREVVRLSRAQADEIERLSGELKKELGRSVGSFGLLIGQAPPMQRIYGLIERVAASDITVLIQGESGTGKELVARTIHQKSTRKSHPFVAINCAALPEPLLESELFGHVKGAFTGATSDREGLFVSAGGGTLFLDELGETSLSVQAKLLRVLQEREVRPVGGERVVPVAELRVVCATNRDLASEVQAGRFREDLYYRLSVVEINLPPLRERSQDIPLLARAILDRQVSSGDHPPPRLSRKALHALSSFPFPGNVRQLENVLTRAAIMQSSGVIEARDLELPALTFVPTAPRRRGAVATHEAEDLRRALDSFGWNVCAVSRALGIPRTSLYRKLRQHGLSRFDA